MAARQEFVVYLSSTLADLEAEREVALKTIAEFGVVKTSYRASEEGVVATCVGDVGKANLYIGILGRRYGYVPPTSEGNPDEKSITELEYQRCNLPGQLPIPRLMFVKSTEGGMLETNIDAISHPETAVRMKAFLDRANKEQTAFMFKNLDQFAAEVRVRVKDMADAFHRQNAVGSTMLGVAENWRRQLAPVAVACVPGTDEPQKDAIQQSGGNRFVAFEISPDDSDYLATLDAGLQKGQVACLLVTPASLTRLDTADAASKVTKAITILQRRFGRAFLICEGVEPPSLPADWSNATVIRLTANRLVEATSLALDAIYDQLRIHVPGLTVDPRLALPYLVLAPTLAEAVSLCGENPKGFLGFSEDERELRAKEFQRIGEAARVLDPDWPTNVYGDERNCWKCFGPASPTADELVLRSVKRINDATAGSREARFLKSAKLIPRRYDLDEYLDDRLGSRKALEAVRDSGCLFLVDEVALLHPVLRAAADTLLVGSKTAVVSISPCDPAHTATGKLLASLSYLRVGSIVSRFKTDYDPRCEIALNSVERVERWLRITIPELIAGTEVLESNPDLVARAGALFS